MAASASGTSTEPYWNDSSSLPQFPRLDHDRDVDVAVVGGGMTGLMTAYLLSAAGKSVALLERHRCAGADTGHTSAHLTMVTDSRLTELSSQLGQSHAQAVWDAGLAAIAQIDEITRAHGIDCGFAWVDGYLHAPIGEPIGREIDGLEKEAAFARELGFDATFEREVPFAGVPGIRFADQARFHPRKFLAGLTAAIRSMGGEIYEHSEAEEFCKEPLRVKANGHWLGCNDLVIATHDPLVGVTDPRAASVFQTKLALYTSYVVAGRVPKGTVPDALFWDTLDPYHFVRIDPHRDYDLLIFGGEDHKTGQEANTSDRYARLEATVTSRVPEIALDHRWSGQVIATPDGLPYIGRMTDHQYAATGFNGNGLTFGTLAALMISDAILGRANPWAALLDPSRTAIRHGLWDYLKENADYPYYMIRDRFAGADGRSLRSVKRGEGKIIEQKGEKVAAFRATDGMVTVRSAVCPHMGCLVGWNNAERTWDCPCHGSRFTPAGDVISGPAESPLPEVG